MNARFTRMGGFARDRKKFAKYGAVRHCDCMMQYKEWDCARNEIVLPQYDTYT